jgi:hypothetical protein
VDTTTETTVTGNSNNSLGDISFNLRFEVLKSG